MPKKCAGVWNRQHCTHLLQVDPAAGLCAVHHCFDYAHVGHRVFNGRGHWRVVAHCKSTSSCSSVASFRPLLSILSKSLSKFVSLFLSCLFGDT